MDTIVLSIPIDNIDIKNYDRFTPNAITVLRSNKFIKGYNNPSRQEILCDYKPKLTLCRRFPREKSTLTVEFSAPKIVFNGDNISEVDDSYFDELVDKLYQKIQTMGVYISKDYIINAPVSAFHPSKNILIVSGYTSRGIIAELRKINVPKRFDVDNKTFRNNGYSLQFRTEVNSIVFYDKIADIGKPVKSSIDQEKTNAQLELFDTIENNRRQNPIEIFRMEIRLNGKQKIKEVLRKVGYGHIINPTLKDIFKKDLCQKILKTYWEEIILENNIFLFGIEEKPQKILNDILKHPPDGQDKIKQLKQAIFLTGIIALCKDEEGVRGLRAIVEESFSQRTWYRTVSDELKKANKAYKPTNCYGFISQITEAIDKFERIDSSSLTI